MNPNNLSKAIFDQSAVVIDDVEMALIEARKRQIIDVDDEKLKALQSLLRQSIQGSFMKMGSSIDRLIKSYTSK